MRNLFKMPDCNSTCYLLGGLADGTPRPTPDSWNAEVTVAVWNFDVGLLFDAVMLLGLLDTDGASASTLEEGFPTVRKPICVSHIQGDLWKCYDSTADDFITWYSHN